MGESVTGISPHYASLITNVYNPSHDGSTSGAQSIILKNQALHIPAFFCAERDFIPSFLAFMKIFDSTLFHSIFCPAIVVPRTTYWTPDASVKPAVPHCKMVINLISVP